MGFIHSRVEGFEGSCLCSYIHFFFIKLYITLLSGIYVLPLVLACPSPVNDVESCQVVSLRFCCCICCFCCGLKASAAAFMVFLCSVVNSVEVCVMTLKAYIINLTVVLQRFHLFMLSLGTDLESG